MDPHENLATDPPLPVHGPQWAIQQQTVVVALRDRNGEFVDGAGVTLIFGHEGDDASKVTLRMNLPDGSHILLRASKGGHVWEAGHWPKLPERPKTAVPMTEADRERRWQDQQKEIARAEADRRIVEREPGVNPTPFAERAPGNLAGHGDQARHFSPPPNAFTTRDPYPGGDQTAELTGQRTDPLGRPVDQFGNPV